MKFHVSLRSGKQLSRKFQQITELRFHVFHGVPCFAFMLFFYSQSTNMQCCHTHRAGTTSLPKTFDQTTISVIAAQLAKLQFKRRRTVEIQHGRVHVAAVGLEFAFATDLMDNGKSECVQRNDIINALANLSTDVLMFHVSRWCWPKALFCTRTGQIDLLFNFTLDSMYV